MELPIVSGYMVCGLYPSQVAGSTVFDPRLARWITIFYAVAVVQSAMTTGLMAYRIWHTDRRSSAYRTASGNLMPILRILIESASLQFIVEAILLALYCANYNAQYILLEIVTPLVVCPNSYFPLTTVYASSRAGHHIHCYHHSHNSSHVWCVGHKPRRYIALAWHRPRYGASGRHHRVYAHATYRCEHYKRHRRPS